MTPSPLARILAPHFVAGFTFNVVVQRAAPIIKYMTGWNAAQVESYCAKKRWQVEWIMP